MTQPAATLSSDAANDPANCYAQNIIKDYHSKFGAPDMQPKLEKAVERYLHGDIPLIPPPLHTTTRVAIIGGGIGGLFAGLLLQACHIPYTIYEASDRVGGRLYTYKDFNEAQIYDYIDLGAMRFPDIPIMWPVFMLFKYLGLEKLNYYFDDLTENSTLYYNGVRRKRTDAPILPQDFKIDAKDVPPEYGRLGVGANMANVIDPFKAKLKEDSIHRDNAGWKLMNEFDKYSTKAYMAGSRADARPELDKLGLMPYPLAVVEWCETFSDATLSFDRALTETVLDSLAFEYKESGVQWYCIKGGSSTIAEKLLARLEKKPALHELRMRERVTAIRHHDAENQVSITSLRDGQARTEKYAYAITTTTLPALRVMDLSDAGLDWPQRTALRSLAYDASTKVGVKFTSAWWQDDALMRSFGAFGAVVGGQSYTDNMSRRVVYPSYGARTNTPPTVLMVSYTFGADALPWVGLAGDECAPVVRDRVVNDLVAIHGFNDAGRRFLEGQWQEAVVYSWHTNPNTLGAFAMFGPGQFAYLYKHLTRPAAQGRLHFAGEVVSVRHAWVVGAMEASKRAVETILRESFPGKCAAFEKEWGMPEAWTAKSLLMQVLISMDDYYPKEPGAGLWDGA